MHNANGVHELFEYRTMLQPRRTALASDNWSLDYGELNAKANRVAHRMIAEGVVPGDPIGLMFPRSAEFVLGVLAVLKAGASYVPLDSSYPSERLWTMLDTARPKYVLTSPEYEGLLPAGSPVLRLDDLVCDNQQPLHDPALTVHPEMVACIFFTSGSTGKPKAVMVPHRGILRLVDDSAPGQYTTFGSDEVFLTHSALAFDAVTYELWGALAHGGAVVVGPEVVPSLGEFAKLLHRHQVTQVFLTTGLFHLLVDERPRALSKVRRILAGGDVMSPKRLRQLYDELPHAEFTHVYGPTECTTFALANVMRTQDVANEESVPIGKPVPRTTARILDERMRPVPDGEPGELYLGGDGLANGYLGEPSLTAARFVPDPYGPPGARLYATGDRARAVGDGKIDFLGRADHQVKIRGVRIELAEVEEQLRKHPDVMDVVVHPTGGSAEERRLAAFVVLGSETGEQPAEPERLTAEVREWLGQQLPSAMVPGIWQALPSLPLNPNGKVDRTELSRRARVDGETDRSG